MSLAFAVRIVRMHVEASESVYCRLHVGMLLRSLVGMHCKNSQQFFKKLLVLNFFFSVRQLSALI